MKGLLVIISCGGQKIWTARPKAGPVAAKDAYTSPVFRVARRYAEFFAEHWRILSAKYGLIEPEFIIPGPYDLSFYDSGAIATDELRNQVMRDSLDRFEHAAVLGSDQYWRRITNCFSGTKVQLHHVTRGKALRASFYSDCQWLVETGSTLRLDDATCC